jgi:hypothetical protein
MEVINNSYSYRRNQSAGTRPERLATVERDETVMPVFVHMPTEFQWI